MRRTVCSGIILLSSFYAWVMTATGIQLTQYRPAFSGWIGLAQPYVLAGLVQVAICFYYLRLASPRSMKRAELIGMISAAPFVLLFVLWTVFMSSYSIMFERRSETAHVESGNLLQSIADELRDLDHQISGNYSSTLANLDQRLENEMVRPEPGVTKGCGPRCREIRAAQSDLQNFQHLREPALGPSTLSNDLGRNLGVLESEQQTMTARLADFSAVLTRFSRLNSVLSERGGMADDNTSRLSDQFHAHLSRLAATLTDLHENQRNLTDAKYRGLTELVNDLSSTLASGQLPRILDMATVLLIALAPDFLSLIMALLSRTPTGDAEAEASSTVKAEVTVMKEYPGPRGVGDRIMAAPDPEPAPTPGGEKRASIYETLDKMEIPIPFKRPSSPRR